MTKFDDIYEAAISNHGLITSAQAVKLSVTNNELVQYAKRGRLERVGQGVYRLTRRVPEENDPYALAANLIGPEAYIYGESVIAMLDLAPTDPSLIYVATPKRVRKKLSSNIVMVHTPNQTTTIYDSIASQTATAAIQSCIGKMTPERLAQAAYNAMQDGYITKREHKTLVEKMGMGRLLARRTHHL